MKILNIKVSNYKALEDNYSISFLTKGNKNEYQKEYELSEIDIGLYTFNTVGIIGKNASGKTMALDLLDIIYEIFSNFQIVNTKRYLRSNNKEINLEVVFYHKGFVYKYVTDIIKSKETIESIYVFENEKIYRKNYLKSYINNILDFKESDIFNFEKTLPNTFSSLVYILSMNRITGLYYSCDDDYDESYNDVLSVFEKLDSSGMLLKSVLKIFDEHIENIEVKSLDKYMLLFTDKKKAELTKSELVDYLSSGTAKGIHLFSLIIYSLINGNDMMIDEIENHFHTNIVNYIISLFKDKKVNKHCARLIFTTHYCELLDTFNRSDNIYISKNNKNVYLENMYDDYDIRTELLKSKKFYNNTFKTNVSYDALMDLKKNLIKYEVSNE